MPEEPEQKQESVEEVLAAMRRYADIVECGPPPLGKAISELLREYADRFGRAAKQDYEEAKAYFEKLHDGPSMICTAKNCALRNAAKIARMMNAEEKGGAE